VGGSNKLSPGSLVLACVFLCCAMGSEPSERMGRSYLKSGYKIFSPPPW
jgi:hypothetical protein